ncbi:TolC family protein [Anaerotignum lactatifermentans]|uniref:Outer membrane protein TolC n=1 Tax=Anaerotignum lactatifermentans DSM 14214 TaxID=1121323 RepID=A0A1M6XA22_9FIRM|nr:TolC family protein [Anaerotignum lactatifermentans]SHL02811.1 Outer membrane protein TolC [[Clostridium] lactatifermentans DSM 14214] [Anaerotignum lactatifermentans DSM 14214]
MKKYFAKGKTVAATAMAALLVSTTAFAAEKPQESIPATEILTIEEAQALEAQKEKELTFEEAVELATKNSSDLRSVAETADYLQDLKEDIWDITGSFSVPTVSYQQWVDDDIYAIYSSIQNISSSMTKNRYSEELTKISLEATVKNYYTSIFSDQSSLELAKKDMEVKKTLWEQGQRKNQLGLLSDYDLNTLRSDYEQAQYNVTKLEMALEQEYLSFYNFIGEDREKDYTLVYDVEYAPYELPQPMTQYINNKMNTDYTIKLQEQAVEDAEFNKNYMSMSSTNATSANNKHSYEEAKRSLKTAKDSKELAIQNAYNSILSLESQYDSAVTTLEQAEAAQRAAEVNYKAGNTTAITLDQAALAVEQAQNAVTQLEYAHDMQIYQFENTELLSSGTTGKTSA